MLFSSNNDHEGGWIWVGKRVICKLQWIHVNIKHIKVKIGKQTDSTILYPRPFILSTNLFLRAVGHMSVASHRLRFVNSHPFSQFSIFFLFFPLFWVENLFLRYSRFVCHCFKIRFGWRGFFYLSSNCVQEEFFKTLERVLFLYDTTGWRTCWLFMRTQTSKRKTL